MPLEDIKKNRLNKLKAIERNEINAFPARVQRTHNLAEALDQFDNLKDQELFLTGRLVARREHGGSTFVDLEDFSGQLQLYFKKNILDKKYQFFLDNIDIGDFLEVNGFLFFTKKLEKTLEVRDFKIITKTLSPLPTQWYGLTDTEERYRRRYLDLIMNKEVRKIFETRSKIITALRKFLDDDKFIEVETPILQPLYGGATAKPFKTKLNALNLNLYLRIAVELYLKRLIVGGFEKIYEIGRDFRNEGMDRTHNPEFTMLELYIAYKDYNYLMEFTEKMFLNIVNSVFQHHEIEFQGEKINFNKLPWQRIEFETLVNNELGEDYKKMSLEKLNRKFKELKIEADPQVKKNKIKLIDEIYKKQTLPRIIQPTFIINHPIEISPLAKEKEDDKTKVERFQLIVGGLEIVNAFSELNNPLEQEKRFKNQKKLKEKG
ncbi:lysine--tRNA ligase, partial [Candidatus Azambacteria bacterium]|nr:lysine--tRNA ligase [Candidatus Azambacteria bacterium]